MASLFAVTNSATGKTGVFPQLGSKYSYTLCIQNCFLYKYGADAGTYETKYLHTVTPPYSRFYKSKKAVTQKALALRARASKGTFTAPDGTIFTIERITHEDPRYYSTPIIRSYEDFFGNDSTGTGVVDTIKKAALPKPIPAVNKNTTPINNSDLIPVYNASGTTILRYIDLSHP